MREAPPTVLQSSSQAERGTERAIPRAPGLTVARRRLSSGVVNLGRQATESRQATDNCAAPSRQDPTSANQVGQAFADLLLVGSTAARCPLALLTVVRGDSWNTLSFGAEREAVEDPQLFAIIAARREPVEVTDPASNPALANSRLARSNLGIRWLLGVPLMGPAGEVNAIFAVLDTEPRELSRRERAAMVAVGRLITGALSAHRVFETVPGQAQAEPANGTRHAAESHQLLRSHEVAALFDVTERTVINWAASGKLACLRTVGGHLRFRSEDVMTLLEANSLRRAPAQPVAP